MQCWKTEDELISAMYPFPFMPAPNYSASGKTSNIPLPWTTAGSVPLTEAIGGPTMPPRIGSYYKTSRPHPWRPMMAFEHAEAAPLADHLPTTRLFDTTHYMPSSAVSEPLIFPNLVTGFEKNPQHGARSVLYTRYTPAEWSNACITNFADADANRNQSERLRGDAVRVMRETDERTSQGQRDAGRRIGERLSDITFWRNELNTEIEKLVTEMGVLGESKRNLAKALQDLEAPLHIAQECLYHREGRQSIDKVHDHVEKSLLIEVDNLRRSQERLRLLFDKASHQLSNCRAAQFALEEDAVNKESAIGIDSVCHQMNNYSRGINYFGGIEKYDPTISTEESWSQASSFRVNKSHTERAKSTQLRSDIETTINAVATSVWDAWNTTNNALNKRASELSDAKNRDQNHIHKVQQEIFDIEKHIELLRKAVQDKSNPLKVAQTRLETRSHRFGLEQCKDFAQLRLVQEVRDIQDSVAALHRKLEQSEIQHQQLLHTRTTLETDLKYKVNALFIDREKCMGLRRSFPVSNLIKY